ncbi:MAG: hypothetical protein KAI47_23740 [Deltaproteobacteria bacterium]|nr:hypothetical protein [Deltaproteobacteria bacterium]
MPLGKLLLVAVGSLLFARAAHGKGTCCADEHELCVADQRPNSIVAGVGMGMPVLGFRQVSFRGEIDRVLWARLELSFAFQVSIYDTFLGSERTRVEPMVGAAVVLYPATWLRLAIGWRIGPSFRSMSGYDHPKTWVTSLVTVAFGQLRFMLPLNFEIRATPLDAVWIWHGIWLPGAGHRLAVAMRF